MESRPCERKPSILLFGPQLLSPKAQLLHDLRSTLHEGQGISRQHWAFAVLTELPEFWDSIISKFEKLPSIRGRKLLQDLQRWLTKGPKPGEEAAIIDIPNFILTPLVVISQLSQFWRHLEISYGSVDDGLEALIQQKTQTLGFCTGLLSTYAVASSSNRQDLERYGAVAIRLAVLIGAVVDEADVIHGRVASIATAWQKPQQRSEIARILSESSEEAYTSVLFDECRSTLTVAARTAPELLKRLRAADIVANKVGLKGRFHTIAHADTLSELLFLAEGDAKLQLPDAASSHFVSYANSNGRPLNTGRLHEHALRALLVEQSNWSNTFAAVCNEMKGERKILKFGSERCVPPSLVRGHNLQVMEPKTHRGLGTSKKDVDASSTYSPTIPLPSDISENDIAIIGLSIKVAGADDADEFSTLLQSGISQHEEVPSSRVSFGTESTPWRPDTATNKREWYGNFVRDVDAFDHRFFQRSPRESAAMDPQQRLFLQAAYQAVEVAGRFAKPECDERDGKRDNHVGVYVSTCAADYENNAACHPAGAFSATGLLRSFIAGKVSHFFGWTGPAMTFDTACSGSAVAIHTACKAMLNGECNAALCGGVNTIGNPLWFQNLASASFLSPTGQCKPFDDSADGYCRGEGIACVFLRPMKDAIMDGDRIFGRISSTAVYQNDNSTPLFVPNQPSSSRLFVDVVRNAGLRPQDISLVEAHGTGTPVGDPVEYSSIRQVLGGPIRHEILSIGSVKGLVGHTESTSGVISLIKVIILMLEGFIPPQASFSKLSHLIDTSPTDMLEVPTTLKPWKEPHKAALINNYGASGSNASMIVRQSSHDSQAFASIHGCAPQPFWITGLDGRSIDEYCSRLALFVKKRAGQVNLADISFNLCRQSNRSFTRGFGFSCSSVMELADKLSAKSVAHHELKPARPVILCFGGQVSRFIGLDRRVYDTSQILRAHLNECDDVAKLLELPEIFPGIFEKSPIRDTVRLQIMLFSLQYSCARAWRDCGVYANALVGHSFGEITALCVSGVLSLKDAITLIARRAKVVRDAWGPDPGSMIAVEADLSVVKILIDKANNAYHGLNPVVIACFNGPRSFTLAGAAEAIDAASRIALSNSQFATIKVKKLNVTNAFHSTFVEPLLPALEKLSQDLTFNEPKIRIERATEERTFASALTSEFVSVHMRQPVFFNHAVQRLARDFQECVWIEAGSSSTITIMADRALGSPPGMHFQALNLDSGKGLENLTDATVGLLREGVSVSFWPHNGSQTHEYKPLLLPPYQFEKTRHWLDVKPLTNVLLSQVETKGSLSEADLPLDLWSFKGFRDSKKRSARFQVNSETEKYRTFVLGHVAVQTAPICPATLEIDMAIEALCSLLPSQQTKLQPIVRDMQNHTALCIDPTRSVWLDIESLGESWNDCKWKISTTAKENESAASEMLCVEGRIELRSPEDGTYQAEFGRFERLVCHQDCETLLQDAACDADDVVQGRNVYRTLAGVVDYEQYYQGVKRVVGKANKCAGLVQTSNSSDTWLDVPMSDSCSQVAGLWVNSMTDCAPEDMYLATGCQTIMRSPNFTKSLREKERPQTRHVFAYHHQMSKKAYLTDIFVFEVSSGRLVELMSGIQYSKLPKASLSRVLKRLTGDPTVLRSNISSVDEGSNTRTVTTPPQIKTTPADHDIGTIAMDTSGKKPQIDIRQQLRKLIASVCGLEIDNIKDDSDMADLGIDSLMGMELSHEIETSFGCKLNQMELADATSFQLFVSCVSKALGISEIQSDESVGDDDGASLSNVDVFFSDSSYEVSTASTTAGLNSPNIPMTEDAYPIPEPSSVVRSDCDLRLSPAIIVEAFGSVKWTTDKRLQDYKLQDTDAVIIARSNRLCVALVVETVEKLGCPLRTAPPGQILARIPYEVQHTRLVDWLYSFLSDEARLVDLINGKIIRTGISAPHKSSRMLYDELLHTPDMWLVAHKLTYLAGSHLADVLSGVTDGIKLLFGSAEGRDLVQGLYCDLPYNKLAYEQMRDIIGNLAQYLPLNQGPLRIMEMGAGTGGTTNILAPFLAELGVPVEYTFTDLSLGMIVQARKKFKAYSFMRFAVHDIEQPVAAELRGQHIILASNAVHATHDLHSSTRNIRNALYENGVVLLTEMTERLPFVDLVFGLFEGWWLFDDGRQHALVAETKWKEELQAAGFGHVDWTDGKLPENKIQRVIMGTTSSPRSEISSIPEEPSFKIASTPKIETLTEAACEDYVVKYSDDFSDGDVAQSMDHAHDSVLPQGSGGCVVVTGATGSLGAHLVAAFAELPNITSVVCMNRQNAKSSPETRQQDAFVTRGIAVSAEALAKLKAFETDATKPYLGLPKEEYKRLTHTTTHIVHSAWPMSGTRSLLGFEPQFVMLKNLIDLAASAQLYRTERIIFQFISSIGVVGRHPVDAGIPEVPESHASITSVLPVGYCEAKWVCERILKETLQSCPQRFSAMIIRPGQIAGSSTSGYWNPIEHFAFLIKSAQSLQAFPALQGRLQWVPVNDVAQTVVDLAMCSSQAYPVYHVDNPIGQSWEAIVPLLAEELQGPAEKGKVIPFDEWLRRVRRSPLSMETDNPALRLVDFLEANFVRMSCGGLILNTSRATEHSATLASLGPIPVEVVIKYLKGWKQTGFLR